MGIISTKESILIKLWLIVNPADIPTTDKDKRQKEDKRDSRKLAKSLKTGELTGIHILKIETEELRNLVRYIKTIVKELGWYYLKAAIPVISKPVIKR